MKALFFTLALSLIGTFANAALERMGTPGLVANIEVGKNLTVGSLVTLRVYVEDTLDKDAGWKLDTPEVDGWVDLDSTLVDPHSLHLEVEANGTSHFDFQAVLTKPGDGTLKAFRIENSGKTLSILVQGKVGAIASLLTEEEKKNPPEWVLPPVAYGGWNTWLILGLSIAALFLAAYLIMLGYRRFKIQSQTKLNYFEQAKYDLKQLERQIKNQDRESQRKAGYLLAKILREFAQGRFGISATEMTDQEFLQAMANSHSVRQYHDTLKQNLNDLDVLRYSEANVGPGISAKVFVDIRTFVFANPPPQEVPKK